MIAATDLKLGAKVMIETDYGDFTFHGGWLMDFYHSASQGVAANNAQSIAQSTTDLGWDGFFLGFKWTGAA